MNTMIQSADRRDENGDKRLELVETKREASIDTTKRMIGIEATLLDLDDSAFARLTSAAWCGTPGCSGFDDQWGRKLSCPGFGQT